MFLSFSSLSSRQSACITNPCKNNAKCQSGFTDKGYRCMCSVGYKGLTCDEGKRELFSEYAFSPLQDVKCKPIFIEKHNVRIDNSFNYETSH